MDAGLPFAVIHRIGEHTERHTACNGRANHANRPESQRERDIRAGERHEQLPDRADRQADDHGQRLVLELVGKNRHGDRTHYADHLHTVEQ